MNKLSTLVLMALVGLLSKGYAQEGFYYQALLRNTDGFPVKSQPVILELSIVKQNEIYYHESHALTTSENGFIHTSFGSGSVQAGELSAIDWEQPLSLKESITLSGSTLISSTKPILKTPRAYIADKALTLAPNTITNEHLSSNAQIDFRKLNISRADIESLGIIDTDTDTTYEVGDNGLSEKNFTSALKTKLDAIEPLADVTDTQNVVAALKAGTNISIASDGTISATSGSTYTAGTGISISGGVISATSGTTYAIGDGALTEKNFTTALNTKLESIEPLADVTDTQNVVAALTAGANISIAADGTISATDTDTTYSAGNGLTLTGSTLAIDNTVVTTNYAGTVTANAFVGDGSGLSNLQNLADNSVSTAKIQDSSITPSKLASAAVESSALADGSVSSTKLADESVTNSKIADGVITAAKIDGGNFISGTQVNSISALTSEGDGEVILLENNGANNNYPVMLLGKAELTGTDSIYIVIPGTFPLKTSTMMFTTITGGSNITSPGITCRVDVANSRFEVYALESYSTSTTTFNFMIVNFN